MDTIVPIKSEDLFNVLLKKRPTYLYGATNEALIFIRNYIDIASGVIDRKLSPGVEWEGLPSVILEEVGEEAYIINCVVCANTWDVQMAAERRTPKTIPLFDFIRATQENKQFTQEMLRRGFLAGTLVYVCTEHSESILNRYWSAVNEVFHFIASCKEDSTKICSFLSFLAGPVCHSGFKGLA